MGSNDKPIEDPGDGTRRLQAIDPNAGEKAIPNPNSGAVWHYEGADVNGDNKIDFEEEMHRTIGTCAIKDDLLFIADFSGIFHCLDAKTGKSVWNYDMFAASWGSAMICDGKVFIGDEDGDVAVFKLSREMELINENKCSNSVYSTPIVANDIIYVTNKSKLMAIGARRNSRPDRVWQPGSRGHQPPLPMLPGAWSRRLPGGASASQLSSAETARGFAAPAEAERRASGGSGGTPPGTGAESGTVGRGSVVSGSRPHRAG